MTNEGIGINRDTSTICLREYVFIHFFPVKLISALTNKTNINGQINFNRCWCSSIAAGVAAAPATTTLSPSDERVNLVELGVYVSDIRAHLAQYYLFQAAHPTETYPVELLKLFSTMVTSPLC
ncbi:CPA_1a_G0053150.mRNA.1.CDS.1 [Saccharomyces cerevisiae]|nr:CPA_1a_G0053150.mRNA.1.CDS.1 [Saccharomyces cerevisiae]CAI7473581.1 CPA_1a_G0053150.mRNA.1.CDS.1 [Saccharomyces cerevisiae]